MNSDANKNIGAISYNYLNLPQRGTLKKGYRLDPAHPNAKPGSGEKFPHVNFWDYTNSKKGGGGISGAIPIKQ